MSSLLSAELAATCNALGYFDTKTNKYYADGNTLETVKDLIRYLRRDDESHDIRRQLGETKVLQADLLPLLKSYWEETDLFDVLLRLIVNLTTPALMLWNEELPTQKTTRNHYLQIEDHLQYYKEAFADEGIWSVLSTRLSKILEIDYAERGDENSLIIERILILIRNILYVPADPMVEKRTDNDASVHDQVLWALHQSGMMDIILYMTSSANEQAYYMHILEILSFMLREQKASKLASDALQRSQTEKLRDEAELLSIRNRENIEKRKKVKAYVGTRHSRFGGTYQVMSMKSISDNELIYHKPLNKLDALNFDANKKKPKTPKNRLPMQGSSCERRSAFSIRLFLKEFCVEFLNGSYNTMMYHVKDNLSRAKSQAHDESYYLWAIRFFMEFNRCYKFEVKLVSETMSVQTFHYVQQQSENYFDLISTDKKKLRQWSRRLHLALLAYKELFMTLCAMDLSPESDVRDSAKVIKSNVFYVLEYREFILTLLVTYDELKMSDVYLKDLVETQHVFLKMLEAFCKNEGTVVVEKKGRAARREKSKASAPRSRSAPVELNLDAQWDEVSPQLSTVLDGATELTTDVMPFDAASDVPIDEQKSDAMKNIQRKLRSGDYENAIGLLRAAREVWPENDSFGSNNMAPEEEFLALRDIFFADLGENTVATTEQPQDALEEDEYDDENEEEEEEVHRSESDFKFYEFTKRLAHPKVVRACGLALRNFEKNSVNTNHCIVKLLHRIAFDCKMYGMLFQVSIFRTFQRIFAMKEVPECKELVKFAIYIMRQFFKVAEINKKVYMESLFWKSSRTAFDIEQGYGSYQEKSSAGARAWTEQEEDELRRLFMEHQHEHRTEDVVDWIVNNLIDNTKTRRAVLKKLKEMCLLIDYKGSKKSAVTSKIPQNWGAEEETELRELFENFKDAVDPLTCIMDRLTVKRPKNRIIEKLLVMGLIQDKKEMRKKRPPKSSRNTSRRQGNGSDNESLASGSGSDSESEDDTRGSSSQPRTSRNKTNSSSSKKKASGSSRKGALVQVSATQLATQLVDLVEADMSESLEWLKESFTDAIEDFENGDNEGIPLVPIMDYAVSAMENVAFQRLLKALGVVEPFDEQEMYWRISGHLSVQTLKSHCDLIQQALDKTLTVPEEPVQETANHSSSDDEDIFEQIKNKVRQSRLKEKIKKSAGNGKTPHQNGSASSVNDSEDEDAPNSAIKDTITRTNIAHVEDRNNVPEASIINDEPSPSISRIENSDEENAIKEKRKKTIIRKKIAPVDDSEESNDVPEAISQGSSRIDEEGLSRINDKPSKKSRIEDSDEEDATTERRKKKAITRRKIAPVDDSEDSNDVPETISRVDDEPSINVSTTKISGRIEDSDEEDAVTEKRKSRRIMESDDDEDQTESLVLEGEKIPSQARKIVDSDSEDDIDKENLNTVNIATDGDLKRVRSNSASDSDKPRSKRSRVIDSDSDA